MRSRTGRRIVALAVAVTSALVALGASAATASALRAHALVQMRFGKGGVFPRPGLPGASQALAVIIAIVVTGLVMWIMLGSERRARVQLAPVSSATAVGDRGSEAGEPGQLSAEHRGRKAA